MSMLLANTNDYAHDCLPCRQTGFIATKKQPAKHA